ncbi:hypothetical protein RN001_003629 [Aquatica leii]|uniref:Uncharacterized protein n=1 Tax=Aquatica leii TaxID=1421715 RepID=A0AAN7QP75_9COLE|nr:hypothetical protein RN001_003629 [Aquatica leii]
MDYITFTNIVGPETIKKFEALHDIVPKDAYEDFLNLCKIWNWFGNRSNSLEQNTPETEEIQILEKPQLPFDDENNSTNGRSLNLDQDSNDCSSSIQRITNSPVVTTQLIEQNHILRPTLVKSPFIGDYLTLPEPPQRKGETWNEVSKETIVSGFRKGGICPLNENVIPEEKYDPVALKRWKKFQQERNLDDNSTSTNEQPIEKPTETNGEPNETIDVQQNETPTPGTSKETRRNETSLSEMQSTNSFEELLLQTLKQSKPLPSLKRKLIVPGVKIITCRQAQTSNEIKMREDMSDTQCDDFGYELNMIENLERRRTLRLQRKQLCDHSNPFELPDPTFIKLFRLNKEATWNLIEELQEFIERKRADAVTLYLQVSKHLL